MAVQSSRIFSLLFVISVSVVLIIVSWDLLSQTVGWTAFLRKNRQGGEDSFYDIRFFATKEKSTYSADSSETNPVTELNTDQIRASTHAAVPETPMPLLNKKSFKKLPQWDFEDVYNQDAPPRQTTCAQSLRNSKDEKFRKSFLPNIRLFLHKDNINMSEWNRLSHFNNPFGFMGYKYEDVMAAVKLIPEPKEPLLQPKPDGDGCVRCAVVGNGGILNGSKMGKDIDAHDYVFRMNGAVTAGYEEDVGNRTSVYVHTAHSITKSPVRFKQHGYTTVPHDEGIKYVMMAEEMKDYQWLEGLLKGERISKGPYRKKQPRTYYVGKYNESRFYVLHQDFLRYVRNRFLKPPRLNSKHWAAVRPTNGAFTVFLALHTCDIVSTYGFMTDSYRKYSNYYFERAVHTRVLFYLTHDYILEKNTWKKLHKSKIIKLYQRSGSETGIKKTRNS